VFLYFLILMFWAIFFTAEGAEEEEERGEEKF
jgi:hypothetical protein